jgi:glycosyltransferase involved in cell wall biosynthesis
MTKFRFHVIGLSHSKTTKEYSCDAFSQKVRLICKMLTQQGHTVFHYGTEGSDPICTENINVLSKETFEKVHCAYDWKKSGFLINNTNEANLEFNKNTIEQINLRKQENDFLLCSFGVQHEPISEAVKPIIITELGIGYELCFAPHRVFESYAWMHYIYGKEGRKLNPNFYDTVIPNYYDLDDYIYDDKKEDYFFFIARPTPLKGLEIAVKSVEAIGGRLVVAGQGEPPIKSKCIEFVGVVSIEERAKWLSKAKASFVPSYYIEPFGGTVIESLLAGTPVITTDFGAFPETILHGKTGYRCRSLEQFIWATKNVEKLKPAVCRAWAEKNYSLQRVGKMYEEYFDMLYRLYTNKVSGWYQKNDERTQLDWLNKNFISE